MELRTILNGAHLKYAFSAKWHQIEKSFYAALGSDQGIKRWSSHFANGPETFTNCPIRVSPNEPSMKIVELHPFFVAILVLNEHTKSFGALSQSYLLDQDL